MQPTVHLELYARVAALLEAELLRRQVAVGTASHSRLNADQPSEMMRRVMESPELVEMIARAVF